MNVATADLLSTQTSETAVKSIEGKYDTLQRTQQTTGELSWSLIVKTAENLNKQNHVLFNKYVSFSNTVGRRWPSLR